jgi:hypothetical protein
MGRGLLKVPTVPKPPARKRNLLPIAVVSILVVVAGAAIWFFLLRGGGRPVQPNALTPEAKAYVRQLGLADVEMKAKENMLGGTLVEITGKITNKGPQTLRTVELNCIFYDPYGQAVLRERVPIVRYKGGAGFQSGETRSFRLPFDSIPAGWNQALPQLVIAGIDFEK